MVQSRLRYMSRINPASERKLAGRLSFPCRSGAGNAAGFQKRRDAVTGRDHDERDDQHELHRAHGSPRWRHTFHAAIPAKTRKIKPRISCQSEWTGFTAAGRTCLTNLPACLRQIAYCGTTSSLSTANELVPERATAPVQSREYRIAVTAVAFSGRRIGRKPMALKLHLRTVANLTGSAQ